MTEQEAIKELRTLGLHPYEDKIPDYVQALRMAIQALEKQIPKKPIPEQLEGTAYATEYKCPVCGKYVSCHSIGHWVDIKMLYCECGQKLDWSDSNE